MTAATRDRWSDFATPGAGRGLLDVVQYRYLLRLLVRKGILTRYHGSVLGWTWSYVKPAAQFLTFYLVMGVFLDLNRGIDNFAVYLFSGIVVVNLFSEAFGNATRSIVDNAPLVKKIYLPRELFPLAAVFVAFVHFLPQLVILMGAAVLTGWSPTILQLAGGLVAIVIILALSTGLGLLFGAVNVSFRDAQNVVELILLFATWTSPVLYSWTMVRDATPDWLFQLYMLNPITAAVELFHDAFWLSTTSGPISRPENLALLGVIGLVLSLTTLLIGQLVFRKLEGRFAQDL
ncbi:ABC transporter permease [Microcella flavibacter]|uniref:ABC transporter permease n=1 Tax=Microcella flavibacter TaxID=1804990 RepID=UPI0014564B24|nr:ABC transporter permease [Microcella flavibacter]